MEPVLESTVDEALVDLNRAESIDLLGDCQNAMENAVIIYDNGSQEQQIIKLVSDPESNNQAIINAEDPDNIITLHASTEDNATSTNEGESNVNESPPEEVEGDTDDDETIATFITSSGQQLALYAVEDSDEVFAVAVYDESGAPPENFHFLLKADVERLIGEGAVKTVKKPSAQKKSTKPSDQAESKTIIFKDLEQKPTEPQDAEQKTTKDVVTEQKTIESKIPEAQVSETHYIVNENQSNYESTQLQAVKTDANKKIVKKEEAEDILETIVETIEIGPTNPKDLDESISKEIKSTETSSLKVEQVPSACTSKNTQCSPKSNMKLGESNLSPLKPTVTKLKQLNTPNPVKSAQGSPPGTKIVKSSPSSTTNIVKSSPSITKIVHSSSPGFTKIIRSSPSTITKVAQSSPSVNTKVVYSSPSTKVLQPNQPKTTRIFQSNLIGTMKQEQQSSPKITQAVPTKITKIRQTYTPKTGQLSSQKMTKINQPTTMFRKVGYTTQSTPAKILPHRRYNNNKEDSKITYLVTPESKSFAIDYADEFDSDVEIIEQSTVQYILCDDSQSDSELTFDELQQSLQGFNKPKQTKSKTSMTQKYERKRESYFKYSPTKLLKSSPVVVLQRESSSNIQHNKSPKKSRTKNNILQSHRKIKREIEDPSYDFPYSDYSLNTTEDQANSSANETIKAKRCRKQQLTVVNRTDSEIIIQPANMFSETEEEPMIMKKRGRRKKRTSPDPDYNPRRPQKKNKKYGSSVELIEIDVDENDRAKGKGSSDKENDDVISLADSDGDDTDTPTMRKKKKPIKYSKPIMTCCHCERNFRKRKVLERHLQVCLKVPGNAQKLEEKRLAMQGKEKRFKCKTCDEGFDVAVSLARHVRVVHSPRKKSKLVRSRDDRSSSTEIEDSMREDDDEESEPEYEPKRRGRPPSKKIENKDSSLNASKIDSSNDTPSQPRKRGRPPTKKIIPKERSITPVTEDEPTEGSSSIPLPPLKKRGRPPLKKTILKERSVTPVTEDEPSEGSSTPLLPPLKKRGRPKRSISKEERSVSPQPEEKTVENVPKIPAQIPKKRGRPSLKSFSKDLTEDEKIETPTSVLETKKDDGTSIEKGKEFETSKKDPIKLFAVGHNEDREEKFSPLKKRLISRDGAQDDEEQIEKVESSSESFVDFKKRSRLPKDRSTSSDQDEKIENSTIEETSMKKRKISKEDSSGEEKLEDKVESSSQSSVEGKRRGRPPKDKFSLDSKTNDSDVESKDKFQSDSTCEPLELEVRDEDREDKVVSSSESISVPKKRGRPPKDKYLKEEKTEHSESEASNKLHKEDKVESSESETKDEDIDKLQKSPEPKKRGRPPKDKTKESKNEDSDQEPKNKLQKIEKTETKMQDEEQEDIVGSSTESMIEPKKRGRPPKDASNKRDKIESSKDAKFRSGSESEDDPLKKAMIAASIDEENFEIYTECSDDAQTKDCGD